MEHELPEGYTWHQYADFGGRQWTASWGVVKDETGVNVCSLAWHIERRWKGLRVTWYFPETLERVPFIVAFLAEIAEQHTPQPPMDLKLLNELAEANAACPHVALPPQDTNEHRNRVALEFAISLLPPFDPDDLITIGEARELMLTAFSLAEDFVARSRQPMKGAEHA